MPLPWSAVVLIQTHNREVDRYEERVFVSGAGTTSVNGYYNNIGGGIWIKMIGDTQQGIVWDGSKFQIQRSLGSSNDYNSVGATMDNPATATSWILTGGSNPAPTVTLVEVPIFKPFNLFKDDAGTDPVTEEGDEIATTKNFAGTIQTLQPVSTKREIMLYTDEQPGVPCADFDGSDDWAPWTAGAVGGQVTYSALFRSKTATFNDYWSLLEKSSASALLQDRWGDFLQTGTVFYVPLPVSVIRNGVSLVPNYDLSPILEWQVATVTTNDALNPSEKGIGQLEQERFGSFQLIALIMHDPADTAEVQAYLQTLKPGNVTPAPAPSGNGYSSGRLILGLGLGLEYGNGLSSGGTPPVLPPENQAVPIITKPNDPIIEGDILTSDTGDWANLPTDYAYQWFAQNEPPDLIDGATSNTFDTTGWAGRDLRSRVTATNAGGSTEAYSALSGEVQPRPSNALVSLAGTPDANGEYAPEGPSYRHVTNPDWTIALDGPVWNIYIGGDVMYTGDNTADFPWLTTWSIAAGDFPAPIVTEV